MAPQRSHGARNARAPLGQRAIRTDEVLPLSELRYRLGWGDAAVREAKGKGLRLIKQGQEKYVLGADVIAFFARLGDQQQQQEKEVSHD